MEYSKNDRGPEVILPDLSRRRFVQGLASGGIIAGLGIGPEDLFAKSADRTAPQTLRGTEFDLDIDPQAVNFTGSPAMATAINGSVPAPVLRWREGDRVTLRVANLLPETSSIHWHGIILPPEMDGVPGISFDGIAPGETFLYQFDVGQSGTYWWYHILIDVEELPDMDAPIPRDTNHIHFDQGETETLLDLPPGKHTLQLLLGDEQHEPQDPPLISEKITITVR